MIDVNEILGSPEYHSTPTPQPQLPYQVKSDAAFSNSSSAYSLPSPPLFYFKFQPLYHSLSIQTPPYTKGLKLLILK